MTLKDNYSVPLKSETLDALRVCFYFSSLDWSSGSWQMALADDAKAMTAFITHKELFQIEVLAFGLSNAVFGISKTDGKYTGRATEFQDLFRRHNDSLWYIWWPFGPFGISI